MQIRLMRVVNGAFLKIIFMLNYLLLPKVKIALEQSFLAPQLALSPGQTMYNDVTVI